MQGVVVALVIAAAVASRPIEARLWRAGRLSDRTATIMLLGRFPVLCFLFGLITGASLAVVVGITAVALCPAALLYRFILGLLRDDKRAS